MAKQGHPPPGSRMWMAHGDMQIRTQSWGVGKAVNRGGGGHGLWSQVNPGASPGPRGSMSGPSGRSHWLPKSWSSVRRIERVMVSTPGGWAKGHACSPQLSPALGSPM